ncbi:HAD family hydrolase [Fodinibius salsisoli]|uniref:HAD family hydrolase n=1 Tax=Fodinibius salsisoli TaxID=2820877 RepID=A0ABT3PTA4_9BACT|nr:HAD family hydrolase [Fodinibius salsisoli]MCW9709096.1 HAD family hydrolase [Fodinibius salsisoli]
MNRAQLLKRIRDLTHPLSPISINHPQKLQPLQDIQCVAFDFYGTMFISAVGDIGIDEDQQSKSADYFTASLKDCGLTILHEQAGDRGQTLFKDTITAHISSAQTDGVDHPEPDVRTVWFEVLQKMQKEQLIAGSVTQGLALRFGIEFEFRINDIWPVPDLKKLLKNLLDDGLQLGIISNSQFYTPIAFEAFLGVSPAEFGFNPDLLVWSYQTGLKKPSEEFYKVFDRAANKEGLQPEQILYVGNDIRKDIRPAKNLGMRTALYVGDQRSIRHETRELDESDFQPDLIIRDLHQILQCLDS